MEYESKTPHFYMPKADAEQYPPVHRYISESQYVTYEQPRIMARSQRQYQEPANMSLKVCTPSFLVW